MVEMPGFWADNKRIRSPQVFIMLRRALLLTAVASMTVSLAAQQQQAQKSDTKPADPDVLVLKPPPPPPGQQQEKPQLRAVDLQSRPKMDDVTRMRLIQLLDADLVHTRKYLPLGDKVQITNIAFHEKSVYVEINGGPKKKSKWYQHISIMGAGGVATPDDPNAAQPTGAALTLEFNKYVPEMNGDELQKLLSPVLDFSVKSAAEVYIETMPPKIREAMKKHEVLVGMNKDMVIMAMNRPQQKVREKDANGKEYEEWIYGAPPKDVVFVRFKGDEVTRVETAKVGGQMIVKDQKEVDVKDGVVALATLQASTSPQDVKTDQGAQPQTPKHRPTLRREGDAPDPSVQHAPAKTQAPSDPGDEPQWGSDKDKKDSGSQNGQQPPL